MQHRARIAIPILLIVALTGGGWWWTQRANSANATVSLSGSGTIEAEDVLITAEINGRVRELFAQEGQEVAAGAVLAKLDTALLEAQLAQAQAAVEIAAANLALLKAGAREEELIQAQAQLDRAQAARDGAASAYENTLQILENPQELDAMVAQAKANRDAAQRNLEQLRAGSRPEDITASEAAVAQSRSNLQAQRDQLSLAKTKADAQIEQAAQALIQAQARYAEAASNWQYVQDTGADPRQPEKPGAQGQMVDNEVEHAQREQYYAAFVQAEATLRQAEQAVEQAQVQAQTARQAELTGIQAAEQQVTTTTAMLTKAQNGPTKEQLATAETALANAQQALNIAVATRQNPLQLKSTAEAARAQLATADAQLAEAQARFEQVKNGARAEQIQAAEAQLAQAKATANQAQVQIDKAMLKAPRDGIVLSRPIHEGEHAAPGTPLMTIGSLDTVRLTIYIGETDIGRVRQGQKVDVTVDSFPGRIFTGTVTFISQEAQYTPRNVQTQEERTTTVFPVRVELPNADHALKPGMPADAVIVE
jgi:multidrug resistance efflux pump